MAVVHCLDADSWRHIGYTRHDTVVRTRRRRRRRRFRTRSDNAGLRCLDSSIFLVVPPGRADWWLWCYPLHRSSLPGKHHIFNQCWLDVGPSSATLGEHQASIGWSSPVGWVPPAAIVARRRFQSRGSAESLLCRYVHFLFVTCRSGMDTTEKPAAPTDYAHVEGKYTARAGRRLGRVHLTKSFVYSVYTMNSDLIRLLDGHLRSSHSLL